MAMQGLFYRSGGVLCGKFEKGEPENCIRRIMYIRLDTQIVKVRYHGTYDLNEYADMYIDYLKSAE